MRAERTSRSFTTTTHYVTVEMTPAEADAIRRAIAGLPVWEATLLGLAAELREALASAPPGPGTHPISSDEGKS